MKAKEAKVDKWENGCGATLGHATIWFTGLRKNETELLYVKPNHGSDIIEVWAMKPHQSLTNKDMMDAVELARDIEKHCSDWAGKGKKMPKFLKIVLA